MERAITGFSRDELADWFATLECGHRQHVRHKPPFFNRPWVGSEEGRAALLGQPLDCVRRDRLELPDGFVVYKHTPEFSEQTLPAGLRRDHAIKQGSWGLLHVLEGSPRCTSKAPSTRQTPMKLWQSRRWPCTTSARPRRHFDAASTFCGPLSEAATPWYNWPYS